MDLSVGLYCHWTLLAFFFPGLAYLSLTEEALAR